MKRTGFVTAVFALLLYAAAPAVAQTGKISGQVVDAETEEPLPGVNVVIVGTTQGATTNADGYYNILNVDPGTYSVQASFVGYATTTKQEVGVNTDLTSTVNFQLQEQTQELQEVTVQAEEPVVKKDVSANVANISSTDMANLPVSGVTEVINLQAGVEAGMQIRGGGLREIGFVVDGMSMSGGRSNTPFTNISYTSVKRVQVQTGGFNAEYGNVRSGLINVTTKDGPRDRYTSNALVRYSAPSQQHFGKGPKADNGWYIRPYLPDPDIPDDQDPAFVGTHSDASAWDTYTRQMYPEFEGWNQVAETLTQDDREDNDLNPAQLVEGWKFRTRKDPEVTEPNYTVDGSFGGPVPVVSDFLGDLRFMASFRREHEAYFVPVVRESYDANTAQVKLTSDITTGMRLDLMGLYASEFGLNGNGEGFPNMITGEQPQYPWDNRAQLAGPRVGSNQVFGTGSWIPMDVKRNKVGGEFTHTLSSNTFYEIRLQRSYTDYSTYPPAHRDRDTVLKTIGDYELDTAPFGYDPEPGQFDPFGDGFLGGGGKGRDTTEVTQWQASADLTSQLNRWVQYKGGVEFQYGDYDVNFGRVDSFHVHHANPKYRFHRFPTQGAAYSQTKLEFQGMVANVGLRLDYFDAGDQWYDYNPFDRAFTARAGTKNLDDNLEQSSIEPQLSLSPRIGVSFPASDVSKIYFNYGHFRQMLDPFDMYVIQEEFQGQLASIGNPEHPMPKTVAYEIGYEQSLLDQYLVRVAGYYRDITLQSRNVSYNSLDGLVSYSARLPFDYEDVRGLEFTLRKNRGRWVQGFLNYTFMVRKSGDFGYGQQFESRLEQRRYESSVREFQNTPVPEPYGRLNLAFLLPPEFGPEVAGQHPLSNWRISWLGEWRSGQKFTWTGGSAGGDFSGISNNVSWTDYWMLDLRLSKQIQTGLGDFKVFADISNVFNIRHLRRYGAWAGSFNFEKYMNSLHLDPEVFSELDQKPYQFIEGDDQPGDFREPGTNYVPIEIVSQLPDDGVERCCGYEGPLYYNQDEGTYYSWDGSNFNEAKQSKVDRVLENKQYIFMPNQRFKRYLNPRNVFFGLEISF